MTLESGWLTICYIIQYCLNWLGWLDVRFLHKFYVSPFAAVSELWAGSVQHCVILRKMIRAYQILQVIFHTVRKSYIRRACWRDKNGKSPKIILSARGIETKIGSPAKPYTSWAPKHVWNHHGLGCATAKELPERELALVTRWNYRCALLNNTALQTYSVDVFNSLGVFGPANAGDTQMDTQ